MSLIKVNLGEVFQQEGVRAMKVLPVFVKTVEDAYALAEKLTSDKSVETRAKIGEMLTKYPHSIVAMEGRDPDLPADELWVYTETSEVGGATTLQNINPTAWDTFYVEEEDTPFQIKPTVEYMEVSLKG